MTTTNQSISGALARTVWLGVLIACFAIFLGPAEANEKLTADITSEAAKLDVTSDEDVDNLAMTHGFSIKTLGLLFASRALVPDVKLSLGRNQTVVGGTAAPLKPEKAFRRSAIQSVILMKYHRADSGMMLAPNYNKSSFEQ